MKTFTLSLLFSLYCCHSVANSFSFHLMKEPHSLDPLSVRGSAGSYLFANVHRSLFRYNNKKGLIKEGAKSCKWISKKHYRCQLNPLIKWSNGKAVIAQDYLRAFQRLVDPNVKTLHTELILDIKNAKDILAGKKKKQELGVKAPSTNVIEFFFNKEDPDFPYKLSFPSLAPIYSDKFPRREQADKLVVNGPYKIKKWIPGKRIFLERNPYYPNSKKQYPEVKVHIIEDDDTAMRIYETKKMSFLRRLSTAHIMVYQHKKGFFYNPVARFDYMGFGPELHSHKELRKALALSLKYEQLQKFITP